MTPRLREELSGHTVYLKVLWNNYLSLNSLSAYPVPYTDAEFDWIKKKWDTYESYMECYKKEEATDCLSFLERLMGFPFEEIDYYFWKEWQESTFRSLHVEKEKELTKRKLENAPS